MISRRRRINIYFQKLKWREIRIETSKYLEFLSLKKSSPAIVLFTNSPKNSTRVPVRFAMEVPRLEHKSAYAPLDSFRCLQIPCPGNILMEIEQ